MNILKKADKIVCNRKPGKSKEYGNFQDNMKYAAKIASIMCKKKITKRDFFMCMIALKMSRLRASLKEDTMIDICGYIYGLSKSKER